MRSRRRPRELGRRLGLAADAELERLAGRAAGARPGRARRRSRSGCGTPSSRSRRRPVAQTTAPSSTSEWPPRYFVALWSTRSAPCSSGRRWIGRRRGRVDDDAAPGARRPPRGRASSGTGSTAPRARRGRRRRAAARSGRTRRAGGPSARARGRGRACRSSSPRRARSSSPGPSRARARARSTPPVPDEKRSARAAVELAERRSAADAGRVGVALVVELARLAVLVRPRSSSGRAAAGPTSGDCVLQ